MAMDLHVVTELNKDVDFDPEMMGFEIDYKKTMDYSLFKRFPFQFISPHVDRQSMEEIVELTAHDYVKRLPPLEVILFDGLVEPAWGWHRLLPWKSNCLLFEDYFGYLNQYYDRNRSDLLGGAIGNGEASLIATAATECMKREAALNGIVAYHSELKSSAQEHVALSQRITDLAHEFMDRDSEPTVPAGSVVPFACFLCITEEAKLMSEVLTMSNTKADEFPGRLWKMYFEFGHEVRQVAVKILTTYKGPYSEQVSAAVLGMQREAIHACKLLDQGDPLVDNIEDELHISIDIREHLLDLLKIIVELFPRLSEIKYSSIKDAHIASGSDLVRHLCEPRQEIGSPITTRNSAPASPLPWKSDGINSVLPATPPSLAWSNENESCESNMDSRTNMGRSQDSDTPTTRHSERRRDTGVAEKLGFQTPSVGVAAPGTTMEDMLSPIASNLTNLMSDDESYEEKNKKRIKSTQEVQGTEASCSQTFDTSETLNDVVSQIKKHINSLKVNVQFLFANLSLALASPILFLNLRIFNFCLSA